MSTGRYWALLFLLLSGGIVHAQTDSEDKAGEELDSISLEFLQFLGEWETADGEWLDPTEFDDEQTDEPAPAESADE